MNDEFSDNLPQLFHPDFEYMALQNRALLEEELGRQINLLINSDFDRLIQILYRLDIDEKKLKTLLAQQKDIDASKIIASMMIDRQLQKLRNRQQHTRADDVPDDEKW